MAGANVAHKINSKRRTQDVLMSENVDFAGLLLSEPVQRGLLAAGFEKPSPIQLKAIPLGRCGLDLIVQAKSGTGKTCVFSVIALENIQITSSALQVLVLAPTREIAVQIQDVIKNIGACLPRLACHTFIGGLPIKEDIQKLRRCQIAIGSPGRVKHLIEHGLMSTDSIRIFILDEADKLLEDSFQEQINWIYSALPDNKQILALSATYPEYLAQHLTAYMRNPTFIRLNISDPALLGIKQYYYKVSHHPLPNKQLDIKTESVVDLLSNIVFKQCLIFSNLQTRAQNLCSDLQSKGWPSTCIAGSLDQRERLQAMDQLKTYKCRVLVSTDLTSRGIDADKVDLVINLDVPFDHETYLHRIGRAGRFGSFGAAVSIVSEGKEEQELWAVERKCHTKIHPLPDPIPNDLVKIELDINTEDLICMEQLVTRHSSTTENDDMKFEKAPTTNSCDMKSEQSDYKNSSQNNSKILLDKPAQTTEMNSEKLAQLETNGHTDSKVSNDYNTSSKDCSKTARNENHLNTSEQNIVKSKDNLNKSSDGMFSNSNEKLVEKASDISQSYPSQQKYVFHDEVSENLRENVVTENSRKSKNEKEAYSKSLGVSQDTGSHFEPNSDKSEIKMRSSMNLNQSNSADSFLTKADSLDSPVVDVQDFLTTSVSFSKSKKSEYDTALRDETDSTILASNEGLASVSQQCNMSSNSFHERHSKLKAKLEKESVISDSTTDLLKCCSDLVKSMQSLNIGKGSSCQYDLLSTVDVKPKVVEKSLQKTDIMKISTKLLDSDAQSGNTDTNLCSEFDSNLENIRSESRMDNCESKTSIRPKGRTYKDILESFNQFQSAANSDTKPCDFVSEIKQDLLNASKTSMVDENLKAELKNLDEIYSNVVKSRNTKTVPVPTAKSLISTGTQTYMPCHSSKLANRMAVSSLAEFSTNRNLDNVVWDPMELQPREDNVTDTRVKEPKEPKSLMCNQKSSDKVTLDKKMLNSDESYCKRNQSESRKSKLLKGRQIQYDLQEMEQKIQTGVLKFGTSNDLYDDDQPQSRILVANQNGVAYLSDVEQLPARRTSSDRSSSESEICETTSDSSPVSTTRRKNKMEAVHTLNESSKFNSKMSHGVNSNVHRMNNQNFHQEISKDRKKKSQKSGLRRHDSHHHSDEKSQNSHAPDENWYEYDDTVPAPVDGDYTQWYKQYYQTKRQSYSDQDMKARSTYPYYHSYKQYYDQLNNREHQEDRNSRNAYSDWYQQWYQWYINYYGYSNQNSYYHHMPNGYYPYSYPYPNEQYSGIPFHSVQSKTTEEAMKDSIKFAKIQKEYIKQMLK